MWSISSHIRLIPFTHVIRSSFHCSYVIPSLAASVVINIPKYFESTLHYYPVGEVPTLLDNGTTVNVTQYQVRTMVARWL